MIHLTHTGQYAGTRFCGARRDDGEANVHGSHAPLHKPEYREQVCTECMKYWALNAYASKDRMPDYILAIRKAVRAEKQGQVAA